MAPRKRGEKKEKKIRRDRPKLRREEDEDVEEAPKSSVFSKLLKIGALGAAAVLAHQGIKHMRRGPLVSVTYRPIPDYHKPPGKNGPLIFTPTAEQARLGALPLYGPRLNVQSANGFVDKAKNAVKKTLSIMAPLGMLVGTALVAHKLGHNAGHDKGWALGRDQGVQLGLQNATVRHAMENYRSYNHGLTHGHLANFK